MKLALFLLVGASAFAQVKYDLLLKGGHVVDAKNHLNAISDVAIKDGKIAEVSKSIDPATALKTVDAKGLYVTPALARQSHTPGIIRYFQMATRSATA